MTYNDIQLATGVPAGSVKNIIKGAVKTVNQANATAILNATPMVPTGTISGIGVARRLQALAWMGWTSAEVAARCGITERRIRLLRLGRQSRNCLNASEVRVTTLLTIRNVYETLRDHPGPSQRAKSVRTTATNRDWVGPDAWSESSIDDPQAKPNHKAGRHTVENIKFLASNGVRIRDIATRLGIDRSSVWTVLKREDLRQRQLGQAA